MSNGATTSTRNGHVGSSQRFRGDRRCPICNGAENDPRGNGERCIGFLSADGQVCHCSREEFAGQAPYSPGSQTYAHKLKGPCKCGKEHGPADPPPRRNGKTKAKGGRIVEAYDYVDEAGELLYQSVRYEPKRFNQRRPSGKPGIWIFSLGDVRRVLYRLPELLAADPAEVVLLVEGEKDVDRARALGFVATCNAMGAGKWRDGYAEHLRGRHVVILPDNDQVGRDHAEAVAQSVFSVAAGVKVLDLPELPDAGDLSDWLDAGGTAEDLGHLIDQAPLWEPPVEPPGTDLDSTLARRPRTDLGNAERLVARHGEDLRYCHPWTRWLVWDGRRWALDKTGAARRRSRKTVRAIGAEASAEEDDQQRKELLRWALASEKRDRIAAMLYLAEAEEGIPVLPDALNVERWAFNCLNGTIDLHTGTLRPHRREDMITQLCPFDYDPSASCPLWLETLGKFLDRPDPERKAKLIDYWQRVCGCAMAGAVLDHVMPVAYGTGSNGKSTILGALLDVFGADYAMKTAPDMFMAKKTDSHPTDRADLFGKRLVVAIETESGRRLNETMVKELTGGDHIRARRMREDFWEFAPTHTLIMATNHKPMIRGTDNGIWRRLKLVPFSVKVDDRQADKSMPEKLRAEAPGILAWCVKGCLEWQRRGLEAPSEVVEATSEYRRDQDIIGSFIEECTLAGPSYRVKASALYARYRTWAEAGGEFATTQMAFGTAIQERGIERKTSNGVWYLGIAVKDDSGKDKNEGEPDFGTAPTRWWENDIAGFLSGYLGESGIPYATIKSDVDQAGYLRNGDDKPLFEAAKMLGVVRDKTSIPGKTLWSLPITPLTGVMSEMAGDRLRENQNKGRAVAPPF